MKWAEEEEVDAVGEAEWIGLKSGARPCRSLRTLSLIGSIKYYLIRDY